MERALRQRSNTPARLFCCGAALVCLLLPNDSLSLCPLPVTTLRRMVRVFGQTPVQHAILRSKSMACFPCSTFSQTTRIVRMQNTCTKWGPNTSWQRSQQKKKRCGRKRKFQPFSAESEGARRRGNATSKHSPGEDLRKKTAHTHDLRRRRIRFAWLSLTCPAQSSRQVQPTPLGGFGIACRLLHSP